MSFNINSLIIDRTAIDVAVGNEKGWYSASDLNRVGQAINYVAGRLRELGHDVQTSQKENWTNQDWMSKGQSAQRLAELEMLRREIAVFASTPEVPETMSGLTYQRANDIEKILSDLDALISRTWLTMRRANAPGFYAGANPLPTEYVYEGRTWAELDALNLTWDDWDSATFFKLQYETF